MGNLSPNEIAGVARAVGFSTDPDTWATSVAIAMAESSGNTGVVNPLHCVGLWQINQPAHSREHPGWTIQWLQDPIHNGTAAYVLSNGGKDWRPWSTYTSGAFKLNILQARQAIQDPTDITHDTQIPGNKGPAGNILGPLAGIESFGKVVSDRSTWVRVAEFLAGGILLVIVLIKLLGKSKVVKGVAKDAAIGALL